MGASAAETASLSLRTLCDCSIAEAAEKLPAGERDPSANRRRGQPMLGRELLDGELGRAEVAAGIARSVAPVLSQRGRELEPLDRGLRQLMLVDLGCLELERPGVAVLPASGHRDRQCN